MDPVILYTLLAVGGLALFGAISGIYKGDQRTCPGCDAEVGVHSRACRHCGYRSAAPSLSGLQEFEDRPMSGR